MNATTNRQVNTWLYGLKAIWKPTDKWTLTEDVYRTKANRPEGGQDTFVTAGLVSSTPNAPDTLYFKDLPNSLPSLNVVVPPSQLGLSTCPAGHREFNHCRPMLVHRADELGVPEQQQVLVDALRWA